MTNVLEAISNIVKNPFFKLDFQKTGKNRANLAGDALEKYIQDAFADSFGLTGSIRDERLNQVFSYLGNKNNPPDLMINGGDAIEIKKIESKNSQLALNSSYPKSRLFSDNPMITKACRECECWEAKDFIYAVGVANNSSIKSLFFVYGDCYAAEKGAYEKIKSVISDSIKTIATVELTETKELGKIKKVDPLGITDIRVRGMWHIENPFKTFNYIVNDDSSAIFQGHLLLTYEKYNSFPGNSIQKLDSLVNDKKIEIKDVKVKEPNNPAKLKSCKLITFKF